MKNDSTTKYVLTLDYGYLPIRYNKDFTESLGLDLIHCLGQNEFGFEKIAYLLLMGKLPDEREKKDFDRIIGKCRTLPTNFTRDVIMISFGGKNW